MSDRWTRLQELVEAATELSEPERAAFLESETSGDAALRDQAAEVLAAGLANEGFLEPLIGDAPLKVGSTVGPFRIVRPLARGGMGMVFEATQVSPSRRVALKVMRDDLMTSASRDRFRYEIEALGTLHHPGIAQIFQAGLQGTLPWFAMEYVEGGRAITRYCTDEGLDRPARLALMADIADAIHHGHVKGVMHRDLKPDNLLVDKDGRARVIDFGVARVTDAERRMTTMQTESQSIIGTLAYMSPEQARGGQGDVRSDVYSLGVVLYQLLTDQLPIEVDPGDFLTSARRIAEAPPRRPTVLDPTLKGDVEAVLLKALEKDPERRYASASALGEDLGRLLRDESVQARTPGAWDRFRNFARRNRMLVGASAAVLLISLAAAAVSINFALKSRDAESVAVAKTSEAQGERDRANELLSQSLKRSLNTTFAAVPRIHGLPGGAEAAERVIRRTIEDLEALDQQSEGAPNVRLALAEAHSKLGDIRGNPQFANRGDGKGAKQAYAHVIEILDALPADPASARRSEFLRARVLRKGVELGRRDPDAADALATLDRVHTMLVSLVAADPDDVYPRAELALTRTNQAWELLRRNKIAEAAERAQAAVNEFEIVRRLKPEEPRYTPFLGSAMAQLARAHKRLDQRDQSAAAYDRAIALVEPLADTPRKVVTSGLYMYWVERGALALEQQDFARAEKLIVQAKDHAVAQCEADPKNRRWRIGVCIALIEWVRVAEQTHGATADGKPPQQARDRAAQAAAIIERIAGSKTAKMATMFGGQLRDYAAGNRDAGSLMGVTGR